MTTPRKGPEDWIAAAFKALADGGADAVRVEPLARALGVTKGSFYWHFTDRNALLDAALDTWERAGTEGIIERVDASVADPRARLLLLWELTSGEPGLGAELAIRDWARRDSSVADRVRRIDARRLDYVRDLLAALSPSSHDLEGRAMLLYALLIGNFFIVAQPAGMDRAEVLDRAVTFVLDAARV